MLKVPGAEVRATKLRKDQVAVMGPGFFCPNKAGSLRRLAGTPAIGTAGRSRRGVLTPLEGAWPDRAPETTVHKRLGPALCFPPGAV